MRVLVLVDGEHHPSVTRWALDAARRRGHEVVAGLLLGGTEKIGAGRPDLGIPLEGSDGDAIDSLRAAIRAHRPDAVLDLSDEPVLDARERLLLASVALAEGTAYLAADLRLDPPETGDPLPVPTLAVIGTGKRTGKTALAGEVARIAADSGHIPVLVAMGRGGPEEPVAVLPGEVDLEHLLGLAAAGEHAASDYLEDALTTGVPTVGTRRAGGGLAGAPYVSDVRRAGELAATMGDLAILEGSGSAVPSVPWDSAVLVAPAGIRPELLVGYLGPYRLLRSDLLVLTMVGNPFDPEGLPTLRSDIARIRADLRIVVVGFDPHPLGDVAGREVFFATTAAPGAAAGQAAALEARAGCRVVGWSARLGDREGLGRDLAEAAPYEVLCTEVKAAAVDVACRAALERGAEVVFVDNRPRVVEGDADLPTLLRETIDLAVERQGKR